MQCPICGQEHTNTSCYRTMTGKLIPIASVCSYCGELVVEEWNVRADCGYPLKQSAGKSNTIIPILRFEPSWT